MGKFLILLLYIIFAIILGILAFVLKKKRSLFPDFKIGYHNKKTMENKETWECANNTAGNLCALFAVIGIVVSAILYFVNVNIGAALIAFFIYSLIAILTILIVPVQSSRK